MIITRKFLSPSCQQKANPCHILFLVLWVIALLMTCGCIDQRALTSSGGSAGLTILVDNPDQTDTVRELAALYQNKTGITVSVNNVPADGISKSGALNGDLLIADMSRIPVFAAEGRLVGLNPYLDSESKLNWTLFERPPLIMVGEYPDRSGNIYALPFSSDALGIAYRSDLYEDPDISAAFCRTQGYPMGIPGTYDELNTIATYFSHNTPDISGIGFAGSDGPDPRSNPWLSIVSSYGSGVLNRIPGDASGTWNSSNTRSALMMLRNLTESEPVGAGKWGDREVIDAFSSGKIVMAITWFSRFPDLLAAANEHNLSVGIFPLPGQTLNGEVHRGITVKMDGIGMVTGGSPERGLSFLSWFYSPEVQLAVASSGHQPSLVSVIDSSDYLSMNQYNRAFPESVRMGVTEAKGENTGTIRQICEGTVTEYLSSGTNSTWEQDQAILDVSAMRIDHPERT